MTFHSSYEGVEIVNFNTFPYQPSLEDSAVDWSAAGYSDEDVDELAEVMLRTLRSLVLDPGDPARDPQRLRRFLHRWLGAGVAPQSR